MNDKNMVIRRLEGKEIEPVSFDVSFWVAIAHYEEINPSYPFDDYFHFKNPAIGTEVGSYGLEQRFNKIIHHLEYMIGVIKNARNRLNANVDVDKYNKLVEGLR